MENRKSSKRKSNKQSQEKNSDNTMKVPMSFKSPYIIFSLSKQHEVMKSLGDGANVRYKMAEALISTTFVINILYLIHRSTKQLNK